MGAEIQDVLIRLRSDASGVQEGNRQAERSFDSLRSNIQTGFDAIKTATAGAVLGVGSVAGALAAVGSIAQRGQVFDQLRSGFEKLSESSGLLADVQLAKLQAALGGTVSDLQLMEQANKAVLLGLDAKQLDTMAAAAEKLGAAVGRTGTEAFQDLVTGVGRGSALILDNLGVIVDTDKAYKDFAQSIGKTADQLNEAGKKAAFQQAAFEAIKQKAESLAAPVDTAGKAFQRLSATIQNVSSQFTVAANNSETLAAFYTNLGRGIDLLAEKFLGLGSAQAKMVVLQQEISSRQGNLAAMQKGFYPGAGGSAESAEIEAIRAAQAELDGLMAKYRETTRETDRHVDSVDKLQQKYIDAAKAGKESADASWEAFQNLGRKITNDFNDVFNTFPIIGEHRGELSPIDKSFERSVDFFADLLTPMFEGQAANFEDIFMDAGKRVAIGFGAQLAASLAKSAGFGELGDLTDATGLGKILAEKLGLGASGAGSGALGSLGSLGPFGGALAVLLGAGGGGALLAAGLKDRNPLTAGGGGALLGGSLFGGIGASIFGLGGAGAALGGLFGGDSQKGAEREARENLINEIFGGNLSFGGGTIDPSKFNASGKFGGQGTALVNPFAQILSGGDDKRGSDLAGIFENAVTESDNFNETIVKTLSLMDRLGTNAEDAKNQLSELFLDGKISIDEFSTGIDNLNILAQEDLTGPNSVADAINIVTENLDNPRVALKGLELAFKEMAELGIDSSEEIHGYLTEKFGPQIASAFDHIMAAGLDTWEEIGNAAPDQLKVIFNELKPLQAQFDATAESARTLGDSDMSSLNDGLKRTISLAKEAKKEIDGLNRAVNSASTQTLNTRPA